MTENNKEHALTKAINRLRKEGLIADVAGPDGIQTMLTAEGFEKHGLLSLFVQGSDGVPPKDTKPKKSGQEKMDSAIKTMVQVGAGISQLMQGLGKMAGDPVKMDMSQAGINFGQNKPKAKPRKKTTKRRKTRR
tara:strand:+ start:2191 stop:2592 length:402 start_codon:yes stop_codon:yes gene_type:complete